MRRYIVGIVLLSGWLHGCATIFTVTEEKPRNKIYSGTMASFSNSWWFIHGGIFDWPFSLVLDTVLLPYTVPKTIVNYCCSDKAVKTKAGQAQQSAAAGAQTPRAAER
jgi:uncharacterized protein YceK